MRRENFKINSCLSASASQTMGSTQTLLEYLSTPNPQINSEHSWTGSNTISTGPMWCAFTKMRIWKDFKFDTINKLYKDILNQKFSAEELPNFKHNFPYHLTEIRNENTLNSLLIRWNNAVVSAALAASQRRLSKEIASHSTEDREIFMACGCQATVVPRQVLKQNKKIPDWAGIMKDNMHELCEGKRIMHMNLLPGDTKLSTKWSSKSIQKDKKSSQVKAPINQILTYCAHAQVRYGYIITQEELVVFRVYERPNLLKPLQREQRNAPPKELHLGKNEYMWNMEYRAIPWELDGGKSSNNLTVNLSLWLLHMLAAQDRSLKEVYPKLGTEHLAPTTGDNQFSSFSNKDSQQDDDTDSNPRVSQLSSFNSKRAREDDNDSLDMEFGKINRSASKRRRGIQPYDVSMSFGSHTSR